MLDLNMDDQSLESGENSQKPVEKPGDDIISGNAGKKVYDRGESIVKKMNKNKAVFDRDDFFEELYQNYLVAVQRQEPRQSPNRCIVTKWDQNTTFEDFLGDALENIDHQLQSIKFAKTARIKKMHVIDDSVLEHKDMKIDSGSSVVGKQFSNEDYEAVEELLRRSKEAIMDMKRGHTELIINTKTGRVRTANNINH